MHYRYSRILSLFISLAVVLPVSHAQSITPSDSMMFGAELHRRCASPSIQLFWYKRKTWILSHGAWDVTSHASLSLKVLTDSLMKSALELLDSSRIDSAYQLHKDFSSRLKTYEQTQGQVLRNHLLDYKKIIIDLKNTHEACIDCAERKIYERTLIVLWKRR